jgi:cobalt-zinc-cadmium efflux system outer membrane protein
LASYPKPRSKSATALSFHPISRYRPKTISTETIESRRLDLVRLHRGYQSQEATLRAAVLAQFPKVTLGFSRASDTTNVHTLGFGITIELPVFDRDQGNIATEKATRQKLFDEYVARVFEAHSDIAAAISDIRSLNSQIAAAEAALPILQNLVDIAQKASDEGEEDIFYSHAAAWSYRRRLSG